MDHDSPLDGRLGCVMAVVDDGIILSRFGCGWRGGSSLRTTSEEYSCTLMLGADVALLLLVLPVVVDTSTGTVVTWFKALWVSQTEVQ